MSRPAATGEPSARRGFLEVPWGELVQLVEDLGGQPVHAHALRRVVLRHGGIPAEYRGPPEARLPEGLLDGLGAAGLVALRASERVRRPDPDGSVRLVLGLPDGQAVECALLAEPRGGSLCVSSQVGCPVGCTFCASGIGGLVRDLAPFEIAEQFAHARAVRHYERAMVMGIGEPLLNLDGLLPALELVCAELPLAPSRVVISTAGRPEWIAALARRGAPHPLAVSLHAPDDATRSRLVPSMRGVAVRDVVAAAQDFARLRGGRVQFEYVVLQGVNDDVAQIEDLADLLQGVPCFVNLIPWNPVADLPHERPDEGHVDALVRRLRDRGVVATRRRTRGAAARAACGQLRRVTVSALPSTAPHSARSPRGASDTIRPPLSGGSDTATRGGRCDSSAGFSSTG